MAYFQKTTANGPGLFPMRGQRGGTDQLDKSTRRQMLAESGGFETVQAWMDAGNCLPEEAKAKSVSQVKEKARAEVRAARSKLPDTVANERLPSVPESPPTVGPGVSNLDGMPVIPPPGCKPPRSLPDRGDRPGRFIGGKVSMDGAGRDPGFDGVTQADLNKSQPVGQKTVLEHSGGLPQEVRPKGRTGAKPAKKKRAAKKKVAKPNQKNAENLS